MGSLWRVLSEAYAGLRQAYRSKGALFWIIVFPILFYGLSVAIWASPSPPSFKLGVVNRDLGAVLGNGSTVRIGDSLVEALNGTGVFRVREYNSTASLEAALRSGDIDVGLVIPENFTRDILAMNTTSVTIMGLKTQWGSYSVETLRSMVKAFSDSIRARAVETALRMIPGEVEGRYGEWIRRFFGFIVEPVRLEEAEMSPPLLETVGGERAYYAINIMGVEILFIGLSTGVFAIIDRKRDRTLPVILSSPIRSWELFLADTLMALAAISMSCVAILLFSLALGAEYHLTPTTAATVAALLALSAVFTVGLGLLLAVAARSQESAMIIVNGVAFPVMFIGGIVVPPFALPDPLRRFASAYPLSRLLEAVRQVLVYEKTPGWALDYALPAIVATIVVYAIGFRVYNYLLAKTVEE